MPPKRPTPLSDDLFRPMLLGYTNFGMPLPVKNTFVDLPSEVTPSSLKYTAPEPMLTAPAAFQKFMTFSPHESFFSLLAVGATPSSGMGALSPVCAAGSRGERKENEAADGSELGAKARATPERGLLGSAGETDAWPNAEDEQEEEDDEDEEDGELVEEPHTPQDVPAPPPGALHPSLGSAAHTLGACKRCCFFPRGRCANGYACTFCHYDHDKRRRKNKRKGRAVPAGASAHAVRGPLLAPRGALERGSVSRPLSQLQPRACAATVMLQLQGPHGATHAAYGCPQGPCGLSQPYRLGPPPLGVLAAGYAAPSPSPYFAFHAQGAGQFAIQPHHLAPAAFQMQLGVAPQVRPSPNVLDLLGCPAHC